MSAWRTPQKELKSIKLIAYAGSPKNGAQAVERNEINVMHSHSDWQARTSGRPVVSWATNKSEGSREGKASTQRMNPRGNQREGRGDETRHARPHKGGQPGRGTWRAAQAFRSIWTIKMAGQAAELTWSDRASQSEL